MVMPMKSREDRILKAKHIITTLLALSLAAASAFAAQGWSVTSKLVNMGVTFTVTRTDTSVPATVYYRTVSRSAVTDVHFIPISGGLNFAIGEEFKEVTVHYKQVNLVETNPQYYYSTDDNHRFCFEVLDPGGFVLAYENCLIEFGGNCKYHHEYVNKSIDRGFVYLDHFNNSSPEFPSKMAAGTYLDVPFDPPSSYVETGTGTLSGFVSIDDSYGYKYKPAQVSLAPLFNATGVPASYLSLLNYKVYAAVCFKMKEKNDGYQYVQILAGRTDYDGADPDPTKYGPHVSDPDKSLYKVIFEQTVGTSVIDFTCQQYFPHRDDYHTEVEAGTSQNSRYSEFYSTNTYLYEQKFKDGYRGSGVPALVLDPTVGYIVTRFDCAGKDNDTWGYKDLFVRMALQDDTKPTLLGAPVVNGGMHARGNTVYISLPFSEIVTVSSTNSELYTSWGNFRYDTGLGTNVLTFSGTISDDASDPLTITGSNAYITDLTGNIFDKPWLSNPQNLGLTLDDDYAYSISYDLRAQDATLETPNPDSYTYRTPDFTLNNPERFAYTFKGWTGSNSAWPSTTVTIKTHSTGDRSYTANWTPIEYKITYNYNGGSVSSNKTKYTIETDTFTLNNPHKTGSTFAGWIGTGLTEPTMTVTIEKGSTGDRSYEATWTEVWSGSGTSQDPYIIRTPEALVMLSDYAQTTSISSNLYFELGNDIDMSGVDFTPIGGFNGKEFRSNFNGKGYTIHNLSINKPEDSYAGLFGKVVSANIKNVTLSGASIAGGEYAGGIAGHITGLLHADDCFVINSTISGTTAGAVYGYYQQGATGSINRNYYNGCTVNDVTTNVGCGKNGSNSDKAGDIATNDGARQVSSVTLGINISVTPDPALICNDTNYYKVGTKLTIIGSFPGFSINGYTVTKNGTDPVETVEVTQSGSDYSFTVPAADVTVSADISVISGSTVPLTLSMGTKDGVTRYWGTFYEEWARYILPEGAEAFTMDSSKNLYRVGTDGSVIPAGTAVVIVADTASIQLTATDSTEPITLNSGTNILQGSNAAVSLTAGEIDGKTAYVMGLVGNPAVLGFYPFTGPAIPANKAYYVE